MDIKVKRTKDKKIKDKYINNKQINIMQIKNIQRDEARDRYIKLEREYIDLASLEIAKALFDMRWYKEARTIFCYMSTEREVQTDKIISQAILDGKRIAIPRCLGNGIMESRIYFEDDRTYPLESGTLGIREPKIENPLVDASEIDLAIIPCLSCDKEGNRLGHGAGYYDRFLSGKSGDKIKKVCLCFSKLLADFIHIDDNDIRMNVVLTEENTYYE